MVKIKMESKDFLCAENYKFENGIFNFIGAEKLSGTESKQIAYFSRAKNVTTADYWLEEWQKSFLRRFLENFPKVEGKVILDAGVGQGYMTIELAKKGAKVVACDLSVLTLLRLRKVARELGILKNIMFIACSLEKLPIKSKVVDGVISNAVLEHVAEEDKAISELSRVAKKTSGLMITVPLKYRYHNPLFIPFLIWQDKKIGHLRRYDEKELAGKLKRFGFKVKKTYYSGHFRKVIFTKILLPIFGLGHLLPKIEAIDCREENKKYEASNVCICFERQ